MWPQISDMAYACRVAVKCHPLILLTRESTSNSSVYSYINREGYVLKYWVYNKGEGKCGTRVHAA